MGAKLLAEHHLEFLSLKGGCTGSSESTLVKITHCWKSRHGSFVVYLFLVTFFTNLWLEVGLFKNLSNKTLIHIFGKSF